jgi:hypothetical protein
MLDIAAGGAESMPRQCLSPRCLLQTPLPAACQLSELGMRHENHDILGRIEQRPNNSHVSYPPRNTTPKHHGQDEEKPRFSRAFSLFLSFHPSLPYTLFFFALIPPGACLCHPIRFFFVVCFFNLLSAVHFILYQPRDLVSLSRLSFLIAYP